MISDIYLCQINTPQEEQGTSYYHGEFTYNLKEELQPGRQFITQKINIDMAVVSYCDNSANVYHPNKKKSGYFLGKDNTGIKDKTQSHINDYQ